MLYVLHFIFPWDNEPNAHYPTLINVKEALLRKYVKDLIIIIHPRAYSVLLFFGIASEYFLNSLFVFLFILCHQANYGNDNEGDSHSRNAHLGRF